MFQLSSWSVKNCISFGSEFSFFKVVLHVLRNYPAREILETIILEKSFRERVFQILENVFNYLCAINNISLTSESVLLPKSLSVTCYPKLSCTY